MPSRRDEAVVLQREPWRERDLLVVLLTHRHGLQRAVARRALGGRTRLGALLEPLSLCRIAYYEPRAGAWARLEDASLLRSAFALARRPAAWGAGQVVAELALQLCPEGQEQEAAFRLVNHCVGYLLAEGTPTTAVAYALLWFLRLGGVLPDLAKCARCGGELGAGPWGWDAAERHLLCRQHARAGGPALPPAAAAWLRQALRARPGRLGPPPSGVLRWLDGLREAYTERPLRALGFFRRAAAVGDEGAWPPLAGAGP